MPKLSLDKSVKFKRLLHLTKMPRPYITGLLDAFWSAAHSNGNPIIGSDLAVEIASEWPGERGRWFAWMRDERWIETCGKNKWRIKDYFDHCPDYVIKRIARDRGVEYKGLRQQLMSEYRNPAESGGIRRRKKDSGGILPRPDQPSPDKPSPDQPNPSSSCSEPAMPASGPNVVFLNYPVSANGGADWPLFESKLAQYRESFPGIDVSAECRKARQWCIDNPTKRKTPKGMPQFLSGWLGRAQNRGADGRGNSVGSGGQSRVRAEPGKYDGIGTTIDARLPKTEPPVGSKDLPSPDARAGHREDFPGPAPDV